MTKDQVYDTIRMALAELEHRRRFQAQLQREGTLLLEANRALVASLARAISYISKVKPRKLKEKELLEALQAAWFHGPRSMEPTLTAALGRVDNLPMRTWIEMGEQLEALEMRIRELEPQVITTTDGCLAAAEIEDCRSKIAALYWVMKEDVWKDRSLVSPYTALGKAVAKKRKGRGTGKKITSFDPSPMCQECGNPMARYEQDGKQGWGCDLCGWSEDDA